MGIYSGIKSKRNNDLGFTGLNKRKHHICLYEFNEGHVPKMSEDELVIYSELREYTVGIWEGYFGVEKVILFE